MAANGALGCTSFEFVFGQPLQLRGCSDVVSRMLLDLRLLLVFLPSLSTLWRTIHRNSVADKVIREADFRTTTTR